MATYRKNILLILPWSEPDRWVFSGCKSKINVKVCQVPRLHQNRSIASTLQAVLAIARTVESHDCIVTWEAASALATGLAMRLKKCKKPWVALGIIPKAHDSATSRVLRHCLANASAITCFSQADTSNLLQRFHLQAQSVTPTVWQPSRPALLHQSHDWLAVGASNRDDTTLTKSVEKTGILVHRYARTVSQKTSPFVWHCDAAPPMVEAAFHQFRYQLVILQSSDYASGLSVAIRAGYAGQLLVATDTSHMRELVHHGKNGLLVKVGDADHLSETIQSITAGDINVDMLRHNLHAACLRNNSYEVLREHIETMVNVCI